MNRALLVGAALAVGCTHRVELKRSPFITPLSGGERQAIAAPEGAPKAAPAAGGVIAPGSPAAKQLQALTESSSARSRPAAAASSAESAAVEAEKVRLAAAPRDGSAHLALARAYHHEGILDLALEHYDAARKLAPDDPEVALGIARLWLDEGSPALALPYIRETLRDRPSDPAALTFLGIALDMLERYPEAEEALRRGSELEPRRWEYLNNLGYNLLLQGRCPEAAETFRRALALAPGNVLLQNNLGLALGCGGDDERAFAAFLRAGPEAQAWNNLGVVRRKRGDLKGAAGAFEHAARLDPSSRDIAANLRESRRSSASLRGRPSLAAKTQNPATSPGQ